MRRRVLTAIALIGVASVGIAAQTLELGIVGRVPPAVSVQLTLAQRLAVEVGLSSAGPLVAFAKVYPGQQKLGPLVLRSLAGLGAAVVFFPGDLVAYGLFALVGLEVPIGDTPFTVFGELGVAIAPVPVPTGVSPPLGVRFDFDLSR